MNGATASVGDRVDPAHDVVALDGVRIPLDPELVSWLLYKPSGVITTLDDPQGRPIVSDLVPDEPPTKPVGRLDVHSEGLLIMTNDGDLALRVTHPRYGIPKTYQALLASRPTPAELRSLVDGVDLDDGPASAATARELSHHSGRTMVELVMLEGRKREVRRLFDAIGHRVDALVRTGIGRIVDRNLAPGSYRALTVDEIRSLYEDAARP